MLKGIIQYIIMTIDAICYTMLLTHFCSCPQQYLAIIPALSKIFGMTVNNIFFFYPVTFVTTLPVYFGVDNDERRVSGGLCGSDRLAIGTQQGQIFTTRRIYKMYEYIYTVQYC